jgi:hypothetical protein
LEAGRVELGWVIYGHSEYDDDLWRLLSNADLPSAVDDRFLYDYIWLSPLFLRLGATIEAGTLIDDCSSLAFRITVDTRARFLSRLQRLLC